MEKLMDTDPYNRAIPKKLIGDDMFGDTYPTCSTTCQKQTDCDDCPIQEAFARLRQYEQVGLTPAEIRELKERDIAKAPNKKSRHRGGFETFHCPNCDTSYQMDRRYTITDGYCPTCGKLLDSAFRSFCANCGQRIRWEE